ncbi:MAG: isoleucine--tRNA ligase [Aureliella sp.]
MFERVGDSAFVHGEHTVLKFWNQNRIFDKLRQQNQGKPKWSFMDGPITANNPMGVHHAWGRTFKDTYQRFRAMTGHELRYQNGFDCQGLWVEVEVEKQLGLGEKSRIEAFGIDRFSNECKKRVLKYAARQTEQSIRLGYWMDWDDPQQLVGLAEKLGTDETATLRTPSGKVEQGAAHELIARLGNSEWGGSYFTFSTQNNETIWCFLKKCFERGKIYRGFDVMPWSGRAGSAYSQMEVADGRRLTVHKSVFVRFPIKGRDNEYFLIWTTTPWTLTSNVAVAVNPELKYVKLRAKRDGALYYFAQDNLEFARLQSEFKQGFGRPEWSWPSGIGKLKSISQIFKEQGGYEIEGAVMGKDLVGWQYSGPFDQLPAQQQPGGFPSGILRGADAAKSAIDCHRVVDGGRDSKGNPNVVAGEGTGIVHIAPGCGDVDFHLGRAENLVPIAPLAADGRFLEGFGPFTGMEAIDKRTAEMVFEHLRSRQLLVAVEDYPHIYPHCWRTGDELVFRLVDEWFIRMDWRDEIKDVVRQIRWLPTNMDGQQRELEWLTNMSDWMISKKRFWGLALPIWFEEYIEDGEARYDFEVIGSLAELKERAVEGWEEFDDNSPHRPWIDKIKIRNPKTGRLMSRVPDVGNPWLDAGIVPFSTLDYTTDREKWQQWYPADFVTECFPGQFRNWFYALLSMGTMMDNSPPFKTLLGHRLVMDESGQAMHKSDGTAIWFEEAAEQLGVETMRWMFLAQPPATDLRFGHRNRNKQITIQTADGPIDRTKEGEPICVVTSQPADDIRRQILIPLWNSYAFFVNYSIADGFDPGVAQVPLEERPEIDRWILSHLQQLIETCRSRLNDYHAAEMCAACAEFIDDLSNWYIRRNRRRFWRSRDASDRDKLAAYQTLYSVLLTLSKLLAPCIPFLTERMYQNLARTFASTRERSPESVHLCEYPVVQPELLDPQLNERMLLAQRVVRLGHKLRDDAALRVRQPLAEIRFAVSGDGASAQAIETLRDVILDELNIKQLTSAGSLSDLVSYNYKPNLKTLGQKYGKLSNAIREFLTKAPRADLDPLRSGGRLSVQLDGQVVELESEDVLVEAVNSPGWAFGEERGLQLAISTTVTPELKREGMARDFVRQVQQLRKDADLQIEDRIRVFYSQASDEIALAVQEWQAYIATETLADAIEREPDAAAQEAKSVHIGDGQCAVRIERSHA